MCLKPYPKPPVQGVVEVGEAAAHVRVPVVPAHVRVQEGEDNECTVRTSAKYALLHNTHFGTAYTIAR